MKTAFAAAAMLAALGAAGSAWAQGAQAQSGPEPVPGIPGYDQPAIAADACHAVNPGYAVCTVPAKTSGRYLVVAAGTSTPNGANPAQAIAIGGKTFVCARATDTTAWTSGPRTLRAECTITILTDAPLEVGVNYQDQNATKDPKGPRIAMQRMPWSGVLDATSLGAQALVPGPAAAAPTGKKK